MHCWKSEAPIPRILLMNRWMMTITMAVTSHGLRFIQLFTATLESRRYQTEVINHECLIYERWIVGVTSYKWVYISPSLTSRQFWKVESSKIQDSNSQTDSSEIFSTPESLSSVYFCTTLCRWRESSVAGNKSVIRDIWGADAWLFVLGPYRSIHRHSRLADEKNGRCIVLFTMGKKIT